MKKVVEFKISEESFKKYLEECLNEEKINYEIKLEERWIQKFKSASKYYQVYCLYVNDSDIDKVLKFIDDFENGDIVSDGVEELNEEEENNEEKISNKFTIKSFLKYYWLALLIIGILIIIGSKF